MKKTIISIMTAFVLVLNIAIGSVYAFGDTIAAEKTNASSHGFEIIQNDKYVFVAEGVPASALSNSDIRTNDKIHIYEKPNEEHIDYKYLTTLTHASSNSKNNLPMTSVSLYDDVLYITYGVGKVNQSSSGYYGSGGKVSGKVSPTVAYDVSEVAEGEDLVASEFLITNDTCQRSAANNPFVRGETGFLDEEGGKFYISSTPSLASGARRYGYVDLATYSDFIKSDGESTGLVKNAFTTSKNSKNAVQFVVNDGFLFEVLQQKCGFTTFTVDDTLVDGDGNPMNNAIYIYNLNEAEEDEKIGGGASIADYKRGTYVTEIAGDVVITDIAVYGNYMYLATTTGVEVVDITAAIEGEEDNELVKESILCEGVKINGVEIIGENLYVGTDAGLNIYDISAGVPSLIYEVAQEGGFSDFAYDENEDVIYAVSEINKGAFVAYANKLNKGINVESFAFLKDGEETDAIGEGNIGFSADVVNPSEEDITFNSVCALYKDGKLSDISEKEWTVESGQTLEISDSLTADEKSGYSLKVMFTGSEDRTDILPMITAEGKCYKMELGAMASDSAADESSFNVSEQDENGKNVISGTVECYYNQPLVISVENTEAETDDRLNKLRYFDVVTTDAEGKYVLEIAPQDSGLYEAKVLKLLSPGNALETFEVPSAKVTVANGIEVPGVEAYLFVSMVNGQNLEEFDIELSFDADVLEADENIEASEEFEVVSSESSEGSLKASFAKKADITTAEKEFLLIPVKIADGAELKDYDIEISVTAKNEFGDSVGVVAEKGALTLEATSEKYEAINNAKAALKEVKAADEITVDDYLKETEDIKIAKEKIEKAYEFMARDSQIGTDLLANLKAAEEKLAQIKPYYDALDVLNAQETDKVVETIKENNEYFEISEEAFAVYERLEETENVDNAMANTEFIKPSEVSPVFYEALVLEAFDETRWSGVEELLAIAENIEDFDLSGYKKLTDEQKAEAQKTLAQKDFEDLEELQDALDSAVKSAKETVSEKPSGSSGGGGGSKKSKTQTVYIAQPTETESKDEPAQDKAEGFKDIANYGWAKEAIDYLYENKIINGKAEGIFAPADNVKRAEFAKMIVLAFDITAKEGNISFADVSKDAWYSEYVLALAENGIINGYSDGTFGPENYITREEIAVILERVANLKGIELKTEETTSFTDEESISDYAKEAIAKMYASGIISGYGDGTVGAKDTANRAQAAQLIYKMMVLGK